MNATASLFDLLDDVCAWCPQCGWKDFPDQVARGYSCPWCDAPALPPRDIAEGCGQLLLMPPVHQKVWGGTMMEQLSGRCLVSLEWDKHDDCVFAGEPGCLIVCDAPTWAWAEGDWYDWETRIYFEGTRASWRAAWRVARRLQHSLPEMPLYLDHDTATALIAIFPGPRTRVRIQLREMES